ncbi:MAG: hypothetical protein JW829_01715 [Pirellulales bacterium]|nr:hypothetical protein [Pirellulales bacterium]
MSCSERRKEIRRRRARKAKIARLKAQLPKATTSEKVVIAHKLRQITPGADVLIASWELGELDR